MKKRVLAFCVIFIFLFAMIGCVRFRATVKINENGTVDTSMLMAVSEAMGMMSDQSYSLSDTDIEKYEAEGFIYERYEDSGYSGYTLTRKGIKIDSIKGSGNGETGMESILDGDIVSVNGKRVTIDFRPFSDSEYQESGEYFSMIKTYGGYMEFTLELPVKPVSHNATEVSEDGKTLTWDLTTFDSSKSIHAEFDLPGNSIMSWLLPLIIVTIVAVAAVVLVLVWKKNKKSLSTMGQHDTEIAD